MSANPADVSADSLALAVEFFHAPSHFPDLLHGHRHLPLDVTTLLLVAAGNSFADDAATALGVPVDELQHAALFFIEQVLLAHSANHYRILGVGSAAAIDEIKEHHRLLMRLFHPDRQSTPDKRSDAIATRINQAYNVLRSPEARAAYDLTLTERQATTPLVTNRPRHTHLDPVPGLPMHPPSFVTRHRTVFALGSIALVAALGVILVYVNRVPTGAISVNDKLFTRAMENGAPQITPPELPPAIVRALAESSQAEPPTPDTLPASTKSEEPPTPVVERRRERESLAVPATMRTSGVKLAEPLAATPTSVPQHLAPHVPPPLTAQAASSTLVTVDQPKAPEIKLERREREQLNSLVASLAEQYQRGDLESLLALFDTSAHIERGDKKQIRAEYGDLFRNSESRVLHIWDMTWSGDGTVTRGEGNLQMRVVHKGESSPHIHSGTVTIEVIQRNDKLLIVGLYHKPDNN